MLCFTCIFRSPPIFKGGFEGVVERWNGGRGRGWKAGGRREVYTASALFFVQRMQRMQEFNRSSLCILRGEMGLIVKLWLVGGLLMLRFVEMVHSEVEQ